MNLPRVLVVLTDKESVEKRLYNLTSEGYVHAFGMS